MGFKLTLGDMQQGSPLHRGIQFIANIPKIPVKEGYNIARMMRQIEKILVATNPEFKKIIEKYAAKNADGTMKHVIVEPEVKDKDTGAVVKEAVIDRNSVQIADENQVEFEKVRDEFYARESDTIESYKLKLSDLEKYELAPQILMWLDPIIKNDIDAEPAAPLKVV